MHKGLKLSINLEMPQEPEYKPDVISKMEDCMERVEFGDDQGAYEYLRRLLNCSSKCHKMGKRSEKLHKVLGILTPFMLKYGLEDIKGLELVDGYATNPDYNEDANDE